MVGPRPRRRHGEPEPARDPRGRKCCCPGCFFWPALAPSWSTPRAPRSSSCSLTAPTRTRRTCAGAATKNGHTRANVGYADRKFNLVTPAYDGCGGARLLCEVQVLMRRYIEIKEIGHLVYEIARGD